MPSFQSSAMYLKWAARCNDELYTCISISVSSSVSKVVILEGGNGGRVSNSNGQDEICKNIWTKKKLNRCKIVNNNSAIFD